MPQFTFIRFPSNITSYAFYHDILAQLNGHFSDNPKKQLIFDFSEVDYINPLVLPNLLICGKQIKDYYKESVTLLIPWKPQLLAYLNDTGFFRINKKLSIFSIDEGVIGGFETGIYNEASVHYFSREDLTEKSDIALYLRKSLSVVEKAFNEKSTPNENKIDHIISIFEEIIWNALTHGESDCFACFQSNLGKNSPYKKAYISISDMGVGYLRSILRKFDKGDDQIKFISINEPIKAKQYSNLAAILDALFYRYNKEVFGIYDIVKLVFREKGTVRVHSENTQLVLTPNSLPNEIEKIDVLGHFIAIHEGDIAKDPKYVSVRISKEKLHGVHYEFEIPLHSGGAI